MMEFSMLRKLALLPVALIALGLAVGTPAASYAQTGNKPVAEKKKETTKKKAKKRAEKKVSG